MYYFGYFFLAFTVSSALTFGVALLMRFFGIVDRPKTAVRKIHKKIIPLGGGLSIFLSFFLLVGIIALFEDSSPVAPLHSELLGIFLGSFLLMIGGVLDDRYNLPAIHQVWFPIAAVLSVLGFGVGPTEITNPFGGVIHLDQWELSFALVFFWLMGMMFTTKLLDGLDGLATGIVAIGAGTIFFLSLQPAWYQPEVALLAILFGGACLGFLVWNFHPAKIFLGQGGSVFLGFLLGNLAIIAGSKIATTLLVMGVPMLDVVRVIIRRIQKKKSPFVGDDEHLHFQLLKSGLSHRQAVLLLYAIALLFGITTLFLQSEEKLIALLFLVLLMLLIGVRFARHEA